jgi:peptide/nickel transport system substrate-binding protein
MFNRNKKLLNRRLRTSRRQIESIGEATEERLERHFFRRLGRLAEVKRFVMVWILLFVLVISGLVVQTRALGRYYQKLEAVPGGIYSEGVVGTFTNVNPLYVSNEVDSAVAHLVFSGLFKFNSRNELVGDLATSLDVDPSGKIYTVHLRDDVKWQDGEPFTADDVMYTYKTIQNADAKSPLFSNWTGITLDSPNPTTVRFILPNVLASFPYSMTNGIVPRHALASVPVSSLRSTPFNTVQPVGTGPFKWSGVEVNGNNVDDREQRIALLPNSKYFGDKAKISEIVIHTFLDEKRMESSFRDGQLTAMSGVEGVPPDIEKQESVTVYNVPLTSSVMVFLRTSQDVLKDVKVRQALVHATNTREIVKSLQYPTLASDSPFLKGQLGYDPTVTQLPYDPAAANTLLDQAGWVKDAKGVRRKDGKSLRLSLYSITDPEFAHVIEMLQKQWKAVGVQVDSSQVGDLDLQTAIRASTYDMLLYGISIGNDPDVFTFWHSQANALLQKHLNFSDYGSKTADASLEAGRTRVDPVLRAVKYKPFLQAWRDDAPAIALYQPRFLYVTRGAVFNLDMHTINTPADRFASVNNWMIRADHVTQ